jgi:hypothetical protein
MGVYTDPWLDAGRYTLNIYAFQTNSNAFGVQYAGQVETARSSRRPTSQALTNLYRRTTTGGRAGLSTGTASTNVRPSRAAAN